MTLTKQLPFASLDVVFCGHCGCKLDDTGWLCSFECEYDAVSPAHRPLDVWRYRCESTMLSKTDGPAQT